jgi:phosphonate transport system permease protein
VQFAAAAMSIAVVAGMLLGILASDSWWRGRGRRRRLLLHPPIRVTIALMRSVHELLWAVLFLGALGLGQGTAIAALAIPYTGILAKIFSEILDEAPTDAADAAMAAGAGRLQAFAFAILPRALPDLAAYTLHRFECALRSSAILGFFGFPTLGLFIKLSFESTLYGEVWTYLYALLALVALVDWWSGALRRRLVTA